MKKHLLRALLALSFVAPALPAVAHHDTGTGDFRASRFNDPLDIDNEYYPLEPRMQLILDGEEVDGFETKVRQLVVTVSGVTKRIKGVTTRAVSERDYVQDDFRPPVQELVLREDELTFLAQDRRENVWRLAEYPEEFDLDSDLEPKPFIGAPNTWIAGKAGAIPGLYMRGRPAAGTSAYSLVFAPDAGGPPGIDDRGLIVEDDLEVCVPAGCFEDVIKVVEQNVNQEGDCCQLKYHAPDIGAIKVEPGDEFGNPTMGEGEYLELTEIRRISRAELAQLNAELLAMDERAYETPESKDLWADSKPAKNG